MIRIIEAVAKGKVLDDLLYIDPVTNKPVEKMSDIPFFKKQVRTIIHAVKNSTRSGYSMLLKALKE
jgi:hypothetical protein